MTNNQTAGEQAARRDHMPDFDAIVVGAGFAGLFTRSIRCASSAFRSRFTNRAAASEEPGTGIATQEHAVIARASITCSAVAIEQNVEWIADLIRYMRRHGVDVAEAPGRRRADVGRPP